MKKLVRLSPQDLEHFVVTVETSLKIAKRSQFYLWSQGALQGFIPHETLVCAYGDIDRMKCTFETFSGVVLGEKFEQAVGDPVNGLLPRILEDWRRGGAVPWLQAEDGEGQVGRRQLLADLKRSGFGHVAAHGISQGECGSFMAFVQLKTAPDARCAYLIELLLPYIHTALHRVMCTERGSKTDDSSVITLLSKREIQVLYWVKNGKTNAEIGQILHINLPTVKNHVQNIMRKLKVTNRAQAVGKSATLRLVAPTDAGEFELPPSQN
jgi:transcriptional regulator EpsA